MAKYPELEIQFTSVSGFVLCMIILLVMTILLLIMSIANLSVAVGGALKFERFKEERLCKKLEIMELIGIIACLIINILSVIISLNSGVHTVGNYNDYGSLFGFCIALSVLNLPLAVLYFVCDKDKVFHRIYKFFAKIKK